MTSMIRRLMAALVATATIIPLRYASAEPLHIYAAGSLTGAFTDMVKAFPAGEGNVAAPVFGPSGVLREKIERGDHVDVFASADMTQPRALASAHSESSVVMFTRNRLCALGRASVGMTIDNTARQAAGSIGAPGNLHPRRRSGRRLRVGRLCAR
jgi:molybdate transport system substrate-binding protein